MQPPWASAPAGVALTRIVVWPGAIVPMATIATLEHMTRIELGIERLRWHVPIPKRDGTAGVVTVYHSLPRSLDGAAVSARA